MPELHNVRVWYDPNTGRLQVTVQDPDVHHAPDLKHVTLRFEYGHRSSVETRIQAFNPKRCNVPAEPPLSERQAQLLAAIRKEGGDWSPARARDALSCIGHNVTPERGHQIMKALAGHGLLEQVRPRAYTYRLKGDGEGGGDE